MLAESVEVDTPEDQFDLDCGTAGASARAEHARRHTNRERRVREKHPRLGGPILALQGEPAHQRSWARGAGGEEKVEQRLAKLVRDDVVVLHDRRMPGSRANIDHIAVAPSGVWVIDTKRYKGKLAIRKPLFGEPKLIIGGRDRTKLIDGLAAQVAVVEATVRPSTPVRGALCFVDTDLPLLGNPSFNGYPLLYVRGLAKRLNADGPLATDEVRRVAGELARLFPSA